MKTKISKMLVAAICLGFLCFINNVNADELDNIAQDIVGVGIPADVADELVSGSGSTLGERALDMVANGAITESQYKRMSDLFAGYPQEKRMALKDFYDAGGGPKMYDLATEAGHKRLNDAVSLRDHAKDLRQQGASREEIRNRLINEGVNPARANALLKEGVERRRDRRQDRREDVKDRREDVRDRREDRHDRREDVKDRGEDVRDRKEDIKDRREDKWDATHNPPPGTPGYRRDKLEDVKDRREDVRDRKEDVRDRREDRGDRREDVRDRRENRRDRREDIRERHHDRGVRDLGKGEGRGGRGRGGERRSPSSRGGSRRGR